MDDLNKMTNSQFDGAAGNFKSGQDSFSDQAKSVGRDLKSKASDIADTVTRTAKTQAQGLTSAAGDIAGDAKEKMQSVMNEQKDAGADYLGTIADAVHRAASELNPLPEPTSRKRRPSSRPRPSSHCSDFSASAIRSSSI